MGSVMAADQFIKRRHVNTLKFSLAAMLAAVALSSRCNAEFVAPASIASSLIQYTSMIPGGGSSTSRLVLYNSDQTWVEINSSYTSNMVGHQYGTLPTESGTYTYSVDPSNRSHGTIVYGGATNPGYGTIDNLYFFGPNSGSQTPSNLSLPPQPAFSWAPIQNTNGGVNLSNRCQLPAGDVAISGFVVQSPGPRWVILRAVGATLGKFGVSGVVSSPSFTLFDSAQSVIGASSVWSSDPNLTGGYSTIFSLAGAFPLASGSDEGVLFVQLSPGAYTGVFKAASAGAILCEVYILQF
jgi:hypothetical protein